MNPGRRIDVPNHSELRDYLHAETAPDVRLRLTLLRLVASLPKAITLEAICEIVDVPLSTAYVWLRAWRKRGYAGVCHPTETGGDPGRPPSLGAHAMIELKVLLSERPYWETRDIQALIEAQWGIMLSRSQVTRILREKLGMHYSKPYPHDAKRPDDAADQLEASLIDAYNSLTDQGLAESEIAIGFLDEASPQLNANTVRVWHFGAGEIVKNTAKLKANAIGFYALLGHSVSSFLDMSSQEAIADFLATIRQAHPDYRAIIVVLDNFSSHRGARVQEAAEKYNIRLVYLPPYAPDLNPIEFIWKTIKRVISVTFIANRDDLRQQITLTWNDAVKHCSYAKSWVEKFVPSIITYKEFCG